MVGSHPLRQEAQSETTPLPMLQVLWLGIRSYWSPTRLHAEVRVQISRCEAGHVMTSILEMVAHSEEVQNRVWPTSLMIPGQVPNKVPFI